MKFLKENYVALFILTLGLVLVLPSLFLPWSLIDDGERLIISQQMTESLAKGDFYNFIYHPVDQISGRFRPIYWIFHWLVFLIDHKIVWLHHLVRVAIFSIAASAFYILVSRFISKTTGLFSLAFFLFFAPNLENWWRLGPQEPLILLFLLAGFWFLVKQKLLWSILFFGLALLTKETTIFIFLPLLFLLPFVKSKDLKRATISVGLMSALLVSVLFLLKKSTGYTVAYQFSLDQVQESIRAYSSLFSSLGLRFLLLLTLGTFLLSLVKDLKRKKVSTHLLFSSWGILWFISAFTIQLPWQHPLGRYLLPAILGLAIFIGIQSEKILNYSQKILAGKQKIIGLGTILLFGLAWAVFIFYNLLSIFQFSDDYWAREQANREAVYQIASLTPSGGNVHLNLSDELNAREWFVEIPIHLRLFYKRDDVKVDYFDPGGELSKGDIVVSWSEFQRYSPEQMNGFLEKKAKKNLRIERIARRFVTSPREFFRYVISGRFLIEGINPFIFTKLYYWDIYTVI